MKIKVKTRLNQLDALNQVWDMNIVPDEREKVFDAMGHGKELRTIASVAARLKKKMLKKAIDKEGEEKNKDFTLSLEYFECYYLEIIARLGSEKFPTHTYERNTLQNLADQLNQKLA